jgi:hypothetical protein
MRAVHREPTDERALRHLEAMLSAHPELLVRDPELVDKLDLARNAKRRLFSGLPPPED